MDLCSYPRDLDSIFGNSQRPPCSVCLRLFDDMVVDHEPNFLSHSTTQIEVGIVKINC